MDSDSNTSSMPERVYRPGDPWIDLEDTEQYRIGGWHPVEIGDKLHSGRYTIMHKLGFGGYSIVWLAFDHHEQRYVAIKVGTAECLSTIHEAHILEKLQTARTLPSTRNVSINVLPELYDTFSVDGSNGTHRCIVMEPLRCNIFHTQEVAEIGCSQIRVARCIAAQVVIAVQAVHSAGVAHGDIQPGNVMLRHPQLQQLSRQELYERYGSPRREALERIDGQPLTKEAPSALVVPLNWTKTAPDLRLEDCGACLTDFGEAWIIRAEAKRESNCPAPWQAPEGSLDPAAIGLPTDIWSLGCTLYDIMGTRPLFEAPDLDSGIFDQMVALNTLPEKLWNNWDARHEFFDDDSQDKPKPNVDGFGPGSESVRKRVCEDLALALAREDFSPIPQAEAEAFAEMLEMMVVFEPSQRATIDEVADCRWMTQWGLPELESLASLDLDQPGENAMPVSDTDQERDLEMDMASAELTVIQGIWQWLVWARDIIVPRRSAELQEA